MRSRRTLPILGLLAADAISISGNVAALVAIPWFVLLTTGSPTRTGITAFAGLVPVVCSGILAGPIIDRLGYRRMSVVSDVASAMAVALIPVLHTTVGLAFWQLVALVFLGGLLDAPGTTARAALLPDLAARAGWSMERASGSMAAVERGARLVGAPLAGIAIAAVGAANVLWIDAASFVASAVLVICTVPATARAGVSAGESQPRYVAEIADGFRFLRSDRTLSSLVALIAATNFLDAIGIVALPVYALEVYGSPVSLGLLTGVMAGGAVLGALAFAKSGARLSRRRVLTWGFVVVSGWYAVAVFFPPLPVLLTALAVTGFAAGPLNPVIDTVFFERVPDGIRGRVFGVVRATAWIAMPAGVLFAGPLLEVAGLRETLVLAGAAYFATTLIATALPVFRDLDRRVETQPPATAGRIETASPSEISVSSEPRYRTSSSFT